ncbi:hypothetical protein VTJ83DRAFT_4166 [Remersonia thermophila]|uniref:Uncharacterized protein n=1 Tax=Remersonia thermophila TaxID=72144 RepID=A0ABR4D944_9PEZI
MLPRPAGSLNRTSTTLTTSQPLDLTTSQPHDLTITYLSEPIATSPTLFVTDQYACPCPIPLSPFFLLRHHGPHPLQPMRPRVRHDQDGQHPHPVDLPHLPERAVLVHLGVPVLQAPFLPQLLGQLKPDTTPSGAEPRRGWQRCRPGSIGFGEGGRITPSGISMVTNTSVHLAIPRGCRGKLHRSSTSTEPKGRHPARSPIHSPYGRPHTAPHPTTFVPQGSCTGKTIPPARVLPHEG